jgi:hypothetical protein
MTTTQELLKRPESFQLYDQLSEPKDVWKYFLMLTETPRPSHDLDLVRSKFLQIAEKIGCEASTDAAGNVLIRKYVVISLSASPSGLDVYIYFSFHMLGKPLQDSSMFLEFACRATWIWSLLQTATLTSIFTKTPSMFILMEIG